MKQKISVFEMHRIAYINSLMNRIHNHANSLYENLMDTDFNSVRQDLKELKAILEDVESSLDEGSNPR
jgi:hypothetical protein|tara:strand:- start:1358 stop:1561 length:204 start_codon:yes stop_codon:yes gene_type:complete